MVGEHGSKQEEEKRRRATAGAGMHGGGGFGEVTGASRESVLAGGDCTDVATAPGRRVTWENLNRIHLCVFLLLTSLNCPASSQTLPSYKHT